jgi:hypothetical protein
MDKEISIFDIKRIFFASLKNFFLILIFCYIALFFYKKPLYIASFDVSLKHLKSIKEKPFNLKELAIINAIYNVLISKENLPEIKNLFQKYQLIYNHNFLVLSNQNFFIHLESRNNKIEKKFLFELESLVNHIIENYNIEKSENFKKNIPNKKPHIDIIYYKFYQTLTLNKIKIHLPKEVNVINLNYDYIYEIKLYLFFFLISLFLSLLITHIRIIKKPNIFFT